MNFSELSDVDLEVKKWVYFIDILKMGRLLNCLRKWTNGRNSFLYIVRSELVKSITLSCHRSLHSGNYDGS
jgi:hypothetical protein